MKSINALYTVLFFVPFFLLCCKGKLKESSLNINEDRISISSIKTSNAEGKWYHEVSKIVAGASILEESALTIRRQSDGNYIYHIEIKLNNEVYGRNPKPKESEGKLMSEVINGKWFFEGGEYGERGGYIVVPSDNWEGYQAFELKVEFDSDRGVPMTFKKST